MIAIRRPAPEDVPALLDFVGEGIEGYRQFAPDGWQPPFEGSPEKVGRTVAELADPLTFSRMTEVGGEIAGFVHWCAPDPPVGARLRFLFVAERWWGTGLAHDLHSAATAALGSRTARLFTPRDHPRARRFYERRGWRWHESLEVTDLGIPLVEYRRS